jgi:hypothetical protein
MNKLDCAGLIDVAPELAAGTLCGEDRAAAIAHLATCPSCQREVNELATVTDRLLLLGPSVEPSAGFEQRVLAALESNAPMSTRRRLSIRARPVPKLIAVAALVVALVTGGLLLDAATPTDSGNAHAEMRTVEGEVVGHAYLHQDDPTLLVVTLPGWQDEADEYAALGGSYALHVSIEGGQEIIYPVASSAEAIWSMTLDVPVERVKGVSVIDDDGLLWCRAQFV